MYTGYMYPFYRSVMPVYPVWNYGGFGFGGYGGNVSNVFGSAIANQNLVNTGNAIGVNQIATPTVIW